MNTCSFVFNSNVCALSLWTKTSLYKYHFPYFHRSPAFSHSSILSIVLPVLSLLLKPEPSTPSHIPLDVQHTFCFYPPFIPSVSQSVSEQIFIDPLAARNTVLISGKWTTPHPPQTYTHKYLLISILMTHRWYQ